MNCEKRLGNFVCPNTHLRIVNQVIYEEYILEKWYRRKGEWATKASNRLKSNYGISVTSGTLKQHLTKIKQHRRNPISSSGFIAESNNSSSTSRYEKDMMHAQMDMLRYQYIEEPTRYVGLPANQIISVSSKYDHVVACERDHTMAQFMFDMNRYISKDPNLVVKNKDIFDFLEKTNRKFNIYEFDLMTCINMDLINLIAYCIVRTSMDRALVTITTISGRKITIQEYKNLMPKKLLTELLKHFNVVCKPFSGKYRDHKMPMRYEMFVIERIFSWK